MLSKVTKTPNVSDFIWEYKDTYGGANEKKKLTDVQCILLNPKWADHGKEVF